MKSFSMFLKKRPELVLMCILLVLTSLTSQTTGPVHRTLRKAVSVVRDGEEKTLSTYAGNSKCSTENDAGKVSWHPDQAPIFELYRETLEGNPDVRLEYRHGNGKGYQSVFQGPYSDLVAKCSQNPLDSSLVPNTNLHVDTSTSSGTRGSKHFTPRLVILG